MGGKGLKAAIDIFVDVVTQSIPYAVVFWMGELVVRSFLTMAFRGRIEF